VHRGRAARRGVPGLGDREVLSGRRALSASSVSAAGSAIGASAAASNAIARLFVGPEGLVGGDKAFENRDVGLRRIVALFPGARTRSRSSDSAAALDDRERRSELGRECGKRRPLDAAQERGVDDRRSARG
jgi:hypothetical protein